MLIRSSANAGRVVTATSDIASSSMNGELRLSAWTVYQFIWRSFQCNDAVLHPLFRRKPLAGMRLIEEPALQGVALLHPDIPFTHLLRRATCNVHDASNRRCRVQVKTYSQSRFEAAMDCSAATRVTMRCRTAQNLTSYF